MNGVSMRSPCVSFINVCSTPRLLYTNPVLLQSLAGSVARDLVGASVSIVDAAGGDSLVAALAPMSPADVAVVSVATEADLHELLTVAAGTLHKGVTLILVGPLLSVAEPGPLLDTVASGLENEHVHAFVGRESQRFVELLRTIISRAEQADLQNVVDPHQKARSAWLGLPTITSPSPLKFSDSIQRAIDERAVMVLMEGLTRGCEHHCTYCHLNFDRQTRGLVQRLDGDGPGRIREVARRIPEDAFIFFTDENFFGGSGSGAEERLELIIRLSAALLDAGFSHPMAVDTRIDSLYRAEDDESLAQLRHRAWNSFRAAGLRYAYLGIESFSESQLRRYAKTSQHRAIVPGLELIRELGIAFTVGLIIMDPFVTPAEIEETLALIDRLDLYGQIASPLKPLRLGTKSPYAGWAARRLSGTTWPASPVDVESFEHDRVREVWPIAHSVHRLFAGSGYRHSDAALFDSVFGDAATPRIPELVSRMECELLQMLLDRGGGEETLESTAALVRQTVEACRRWIGQSGPQPVGSSREKIVRYYRQVFDLVHRRFNSRDWEEALISAGV